MNKVLILEGEKPASYAVIRSLHNSGFSITAASHLKFNISRYSIYVNRFVLCPDIDENINEYSEWLINEIKNEKYLTVMSFSDKTTKILSEKKPLLLPYTLIYQPDFSTVEKVLDKTKTYQLAKSLGMNLPEIFEFKGRKVEELAEELPFPLVLRPKQKIFFIDGKAKYYKVNAKNYFWSKNDFLKKIPEIISEPEKYDLMSFIDGPGRGYFTIIHENQTHGDFAHERIREYPITGGASSLRKSIDFKEIKEISMPLINTLNWSGPIMIEYKYDRKTGKYFLIEVNGRWWGSLPLAIHAGVNFPQILMQLILKENLPDGKAYKINFTSKLLIPHDIMCFLSTLKSGKIKDLAPFFKRADKEDIFDPADLKAYAAYIFSLFHQLKFLKN